jgi:lysophospholipase L1-like esterase
MTARGRLLSVLVATVIALAGFVTVGAPTAAAGSTRTLQYVALGDSYAAGVGAPPYHPTDSCLQSKKGYPALLDRKARIDLLDRKARIDLQVNATCPGATTTDVARIVESEESPLNPETRLVTLTVGGNDLGLLQVLAACTAVPPTPTECQTEINRALALLAVTEGESVLGGSLTELYAGVADAAPNALIVVTGYRLLFELVQGDPNFDLKAQINRATAALNLTIKTAVESAQDDGVNIVYVDVTEQFKGHGIGSDDPFINGPDAGFPEAFHPNAAGYRAYADAISAAIEKARQEQLA